MGPYQETGSLYMRPNKDGVIVTRVGPKAKSGVLLRRDTQGVKE